MCVKINCVLNIYTVVGPAGQETSDVYDLRTRCPGCAHTDVYAKLLKKHSGAVS